MIVTTAAVAKAAEAEADAKQDSHEYSFAEDVSTEWKKRREREERKGLAAASSFQWGKSCRQPFSVLFTTSRRRKLTASVSLEALQQQQLTFCVSQKGDRRQMQSDHSSTD